MRELALLVMTARPIPVEVKAAVPILLVRLNIQYKISFTSLCETNLFQVREADSNEVLLPFDVQTGLCSEGSVNFANFASWDVRGRLSSHSTYLILTTRSIINLKVVHS